MSRRVAGAAAGLLARLPWRLLHVLGTLLGAIAWMLSPRMRRYTRAHLSQAGLDDAAVLAESVRQTGRAALELPALWLRPQAEVASRVVDARGWEHVERALAAGRGLILLTPHLGCWEIAAQYYAQRHPITVLFSPPKIAAFEPLMRAGRDRGGMRSVPADLSGVRALLRALKAGEAIGMLPDQVPGLGEGEWTEFFGRPAYTMTLAARLAQSTGATPLVACAERLNRAAGYRIHIQPLPSMLAGESELRRMNRALESLVRRFPGQYLWSYNRYKVPAGAEPPPA